MSDSIISPLQALFLDLVNRERAAAGVAPLAMDAELVRAARLHGEDMIRTDVFSHTGTGGTTAARRGTAAGYDWTTYGENIAYVAGTGRDVLDEQDVRDLHRNLMNSPPHRRNILNPAYTQVGIALVQGDFAGNAAVMAVQNFARPTAAELADGTGIAAEAPAPAPAPEPAPTPAPAPTPEPAPATAGGAASLRVSITSAEGRRDVVVPLAGARVEIAQEAAA